MPSMIQLRPARRSTKGRPHAAWLLREYVYPGLLSGKSVEVGVTQAPEHAQVFTDDALAESALALAKSLGYDQATLITVEA